MDNLEKLKADFKAQKANYYISEKQAKFINKYFDMCFCLGIDFANKKVTNNKKVIAILNGKEIEFESIQKAALFIGKSRSNLSPFVKNNKKCAGYLWKYADKNHISIK